jgi:pyruvate dehydrogenase E1 component alpha subunit
MATYKKEFLLDMFMRMNCARYFEEKIAYLFSRGLVHGTTHLSIGQEGSAVGACMALNEGDLVSLTHRGHSQAIGFGLDIDIMMAELLGKETGYCKGKGGSMHIADIDSGNLGANGVVGGGYALSAGAALVQQYRETGKIVLCFGGDGSVNTGNFHESINLAAIWDLPLIFFIENNQYGMSMPVKKHLKIDRIARKAESYGIPGMTVNGNDPLDVYEGVKKAAEHARNNKGPVLVESITYRWQGHSKSDAQVYRTKEEVERWKEKDPIKRLGNYILSHGVVKEQELYDIMAEAERRIEEAYEFAQESAEPPLEEVLTDVYVEEVNR